MSWGYGGIGDGAVVFGAGVNAAEIKMGQVGRRCTEFGSCDIGLLRSFYLSALKWQ